MTGRLRYMLDTNIVAAMARQPRGAVVQRLADVGAEAVAVSIVVACEVRFGLARSESERLKQQVEMVLEELLVLPLEPPVDEHYAAIRLALESAGTPSGPNDLFIAAHSRALGLTLVTDDVREFSRVPDLPIENWLHEAAR